MGFGQHQSFYLREGWLHKGMEVITQNESLLSSSEAFELMGIGKNMLSSLKFWLIATRVATYDTKEKKFNLTEIGELVFKYDSNLNLNFSKALIHYLLTTGSEVIDTNGNKNCTVIFWFYNVLEGSIYDKDVLLQRFSQWAIQQKEVSPNSLKRDIDCLIQMYDINNHYEDPEDVLHSPLSYLNLLSKEEKITKLEGNLDIIPIEIIYYILNVYANKHNLTLISLNELVNAQILPGKVFNMKQSELVKAVYELEKKGLVKFVQTNNLDNIHLLKLYESPNQLLQEYYKEMEVL